jgi:hypothetical protein
MFFRQSTGAKGKFLEVTTALVREEMSKAWGADVEAIKSKSSEGSPGEVAQERVQRGRISVPVPLTKHKDPEPQRQPFTEQGQGGVRLSR